MRPRTVRQLAVGVLLFGKFVTGAAMIFLKRLKEKILLSQLRHNGVLKVERVEIV